MADGRRKKNWFQKMDGLLDWKVIGPDIYNPFQKPFSDSALSELIDNKEKLKGLLDIRCLVDGYEVMIVRNLAAPRIRSDHPCIAAMPKWEILEAMEAQEVHAKVSETLDKIQGQMREEMERRDAEAAERYGTEPRKLIKRKKSAPEPRPGAGFRVIRM